MYPPLETPILVPTQGKSPEASTHSRSLEYNSGQIVQTQTSDTDRMVPISTGLQYLMLQVGLTTSRPFCNPVQSQTSQVCFTSTGSNSLGSRRVKSPLGEPGCTCLSTSSTTQQGSLQGDRPGLPKNDSDCAGLAQHALVLGPGQSISSDSVHASSAAVPGDTAVQRSSSPRSQEP